MASTLRFDNWEDSNGTPILDGSNLAIPSSAMPAGSILQVVSTTKTDTFSTSAASYAEVTGLTVAITPSSASSKILIVVSAVMGFNHAVADRAILSLFRGSTNLSSPTSPGSRTPIMGGINESIPDNGMTTPTLTFYDEPSTTSQITYGLRIATVNTSDTVFLNRSSNDGDSSSRPRGVSTITVMEVAG